MNRTELGLTNLWLRVPCCNTQISTLPPKCIVWPSSCQVASCRFTMPSTTPKASRYTDWPSLFLSAWINICLLSLFYFVTGQYLRSPCYIKLQCQKDANLLLEKDASAASLWMNLWQKCSLTLLTSVSVSDLPFSGNILQQPGFFPSIHVSGLGAAQRTTGTWDDITDSAHFSVASSLSLKPCVSLSLSHRFYFPSNQQKSLKQC